MRIAGMIATWASSTRWCAAQLARWNAPLSSDAFPNLLAAPEPLRRPRSTPWATLALLLLVAWLPRWWMADRVQVICTDGTLYVQLAKALEAGDLTQAFRLQFNVYPLLLAALHHCGLSWEQAGSTCGITLASLAVLPLFGWVRRQFDQRIAVITCLLYAVHPELIEWSPEVIREPTFWFSFTLSLYLLWRAVTEVRFLWFVLAGCATALSVLTRFEGLFLLVPWGMWTLTRHRALRQERSWLWIGALLGPLALPLFLTIANLLWIHDASWYNLLRLEQFERVVAWLESFVNGQTHGPLVKPGPAVVELTGWSALARAIWSFLHTIERGLTPLHGLLMILGYARHGRLFNRRDHLPISIITCLVLAGIWVHLWYTGLSSSRYSSIIVVLGSRWATFGLLDVGHALNRLVARLWSPLEPWRLGLNASLAVICLVGWIDALSSEFHSRQMSAQLGYWIRRTFGEQRVLLGIDEQLAIISYHAQAHYWKPPEGVRGQPLYELLARNTPDVVIITRKEPRAGDFETLLQRQRELGYEQVDSQLLPEPQERVIVLSRVPMLR